MKTWKKIFIGLCAAMFTLPGVADNYCEDIDTYEYIAHDIAMCSTHAYNINKTDNNMTAAERAQMKEVIALKTTIMTQQMYKQYESLEKLIKKLKTQLEKAVLNANIQVASAAVGKDTSGSTSFGGASGGSYSSGAKDAYVVLSGAENCLTKTTLDAGYECLQTNSRIIISAVQGGNLNQARKQLAKDISAASAFEIDAKCGKEEQILKLGKSDVIECAQKLNVAVMQKISESKKSQNMGWGGRP